MLEERIATFEEEPRGDEVAFVAMGKAGITGRRSSRAGVISLAPARCTIERFIGAAKRAGVQWSMASDVFVGYGPTAVGFATPSGAAAVERHDLVALFAERHKLSSSSSGSAIPSISCASSWSEMSLLAMSSLRFTTASSFVRAVSRHGGTGGYRRTSAPSRNKAKLPTALIVRATCSADHFA